MTTSDPDPTLTPARLRAYHLGHLSDSETEAIEERYFDDRDAFDAVDAASDGLVDEYLAAHLNSDERARMETLLAAPEWRDRLRFAAALRAVVQEESVDDTVAASRAPFAMFTRTVAWQWSGGLLAAAALAFAVVGSVSTRRQLEGVQARLDETVAARDRALTVARESEARAVDERTTRESLAKRLESLTSIAVMLMPGTRSEAATAVRVPGDAALVRLTAVQDDPLPPGILGARFEIRRGDVQVAGGVVPLSAISAAGGTIDVQLPATALAPGEYELRVAVATRPGEYYDFATYTFFVRR